MDFAAYASPYPDSSPPYSESSSTPRTPSPQSIDLTHPLNFKHPIHTVPTIFQEDSYLPSDVGSMIQNDSWVPQSNYNNYPPPQGSLLRELYEPEPSEHYQSDVYIDDHAHYNEWQQQQQQQQQQQHHHHQQMHLRQPDHHTLRRATFPYVRHDLPQHHIPHHSQFYDQYPPMYNEPLAMSPDPSESRHPHDHQSIKLEDTPLIVPSQLGFPAHPLHGHHHPGFLPPGAGTSVPIQHTDDAASKETQYLRRRCFNCHTTEPPSWRRSTLNPGKIVCNKCGLYERTHLRPRPLRFDELRAGGKTRKPGEKKVQKPAPLAGSPQIKKEPREFGLARRSSVSSTASSGGAVSDWDDTGKFHYFIRVVKHVLTILQCRCIPHSLPPLALSPVPLPAIHRLPLQRSPFLAVLRAHLSMPAPRLQFVSLTPRCQTLRLFNNKRLGNQQRLRVTFHSLQSRIRDRICCVGAQCPGSVSSHAKCSLPRHRFHRSH